MSCPFPNKPSRLPSSQDYRELGGQCGTVELGYYSALYDAFPDPIRSSIWAWPACSLDSRLPLGSCTNNIAVTREITIDLGSGIPPNPECCIANGNGQKVRERKAC